MKILIHGNENKAAIAVLISFAGITSESKINGLYAYYVDGMPLKFIKDTYHVDQSNFNKAVVELEEIAKRIDNYNIFRIARKVRQG